MATNKGTNLRALVLSYVLDHNEVTIDQVVGALSRHLSAAKAAAAGRRRRKSSCLFTSTRRKNQRRTNAVKKQRNNLEAIGKRAIISEALSALYRLGRIRRVQRRVYAPPPPKLFETA